MLWGAMNIAKNILTALAFCTCFTAVEAKQVVVVPTPIIYTTASGGTYTNATQYVTFSNIPATTTQNVYVAIMYHGTLYWSTNGGSGWTADVSAGYPVFAKFTGSRYSATPIKGLDLSMLDTSTVQVGEGVVYVAFGADINDAIAKGQVWSIISIHSLAMVLPR